MSPMRKGILCVFGFTAIIVLAYLGILFAFADDNEDEVGLCYRGYETHCEPTMTEKLLERVREWNMMRIMNETLALSEKYNK